MNNNHAGVNLSDTVASMSQPEEWKPEITCKAQVKHDMDTRQRPRLQTNMSTTEVLVQAEKLELKLVACLFQSFSSPT